MMEIFCGGTSHFRMRCSRKAGVTTTIRFALRYRKPAIFPSARCNNELESPTPTAASDSVHCLPKDQLTKWFAVLRPDHAVGMIRKSSEHCDLMARLRPMAGQFRNAGRRRTHFRREILRDVENLQRGLSNSKV